MIWSRPPVLMGSGITHITITEDTWIGNLWDYLSNPPAPVEVIFIVDGADAGGIFIPLDFAGGSTFSFTAINSGRFLGIGGAGGDGGDDQGGTGTNGSHGTSGGTAISSHFNFDLDIDDGFMYGGGGGGGGSSFEDDGATGTPGGGGGGGQGFTGDGVLGAEGGDAGSSQGLPPGQNGGDGSNSSPGLGGAGGGALTAGDGGDWGHGGRIGGSEDVSAGGGRGGSGGAAGNAFFSQSGAIATITGTLTEAQLRTGGKIIGEFGARIAMSNYRVSFALTTGPSVTVGHEFVNNAGGTYRDIDSNSGNTDFADIYANGPDITPADYEVRDVLGTRSGTWTVDPAGSEGDWRGLGTTRTWTISAGTFKFTRQFFELKRADDASGGILDSGFLFADIEFFI